jgi:CRISPR-associated endoribonuclease Cas6
MPPIIDGYEKFLRENLSSKINSLPNQAGLPANFEFGFKLLGVPKSKLVTIKPYTPEQSKVRGFVFNFLLTCPVEIHQFILETGIGEKNSMGFGWAEVI